MLGDFNTLLSMIDRKTRLQISKNSTLSTNRIYSTFISNPSFCLKNLEKKEQNKLRRNKWKEIMMIKAEINETENKNTENQ